MSDDITPDVKGRRKNTEGLAICKEEVKEVSKPKEQEKNTSVIPTEPRMTETPTRPLQAEYRPTMVGQTPEPAMSPEGCDLCRVDDIPLHAVSPEDKERYPGGALQSTDVMSDDITPDVKGRRKNTEGLAICKEEVKEVSKPKEQEKNTSVIPTEPRMTETPTRPLQAEYRPTMVGQTPEPAMSPEGCDLCRLYKIIHPARNRLHRAEDSGKQ
ncbi:hypothetical protein NDU88_003531 [Pleurodeles waltl]|uniref:Uncharacterized protein n=1 Tax=Pleurodeles waltl TaxID=8319 RepID=A0AAV7UED3_PLEWA|nr:hypothetical protein NDU88_003531 [Pleurodeles waltl]